MVEWNKNDASSLLTLLSCESSVSVKETPDRKKKGILNHSFAKDSLHRVMDKELERESSVETRLNQERIYSNCQKVE